MAQITGVQSAYTSAMRWAVRRASLHTSAQRVLLAASCSAAQGVEGSLSRLRLVATAPLATQLLAHYFSASLLPGDCYLLYGDVGAGKSFFSRAFIRAAAHDDSLPVPSPTFLLQNIYTDHEGPPIHHYDLYRLTQPPDLARLDLAASLPAAASLIEWAERLGPEAPAQCLALSIAILSASEQQVLQSQLETAAAAERQASTETESDAEDNEEGGSDGRWRRIELIGHGERWRQRLTPLEEHVRQRGSDFGLWVHPSADLA